PLLTERAPREALGHALELGVREPLEGLADGLEGAGLLVARGEVIVAEPAAPPAVAPVGGDDREVDAHDALHLEPRAAADPGRVRRGEILHHDALVPGREHAGQEP